MDAGTSPFPRRAVLDGVPRVGFYRGGDRCPEDVPFPSCMRACMDYFGEPSWEECFRAHDNNDQVWRLDGGYTYFMAVTGVAFSLSWGKGWQRDNVEIMYISPDPGAPHRRALKAAGYSAHWVMRPHADEAAFRHAIAESIRNGKPVIGFGVIGPPEACLITGYDDTGDTLLGWNFFQDDPEWSAGVTIEPSGYFRKSGWYPQTECLLVFREKVDRPPLAELIRSTLEWALDVVRTPDPWPDRANGLAAYTAWAEAIGHDEEFSTDDPSALRECHAVHNAAVGTVAEGRWYAGQFMHRLAMDMPAIAEPAEAAHACYQAEHDLMWKVWGLMGGLEYSEENARRFAEPDVRRQSFPLILQAREKDAEAAAHLERALGILRGEV